MPKTFACPFWTWEGGRTLSCEGVALRFKSAGARVAYIEKYCAHVPGWEGCPIAGELWRSYERGEAAGACARGANCGTLDRRKNDAESTAGKDGQVE